MTPSLFTIVIIILHIIVINVLLQIGLNFTFTCVVSINQYSAVMPNQTEMS